MAVLTVEMSTGSDTIFLLLHIFKFEITVCLFFFIQTNSKFVNNFFILSFLSHRLNKIKELP